MLVICTHQGHITEVRVCEQHTSQYLAILNIMPGDCSLSLHLEDSLLIQYGLLAKINLILIVFIQGQLNILNLRSGIYEISTRFFILSPGLNKKSHIQMLFPPFSKTTTYIRVSIHVQPFFQFSAILRHFQPFHLFPVNPSHFVITL